LKLKKIEDNAEDSRDRYLLTYSDLITLLLGLFVILYASASVDENKYKEFTKAFNQVFKSKGVLDGGDGVLEGGKKVIGQQFSTSTASDIESLDMIQDRAEKALAGFVSKGLLEIRNSGKELVIALPEQLLFEPGKATIQAKGIVAIDSIVSVLKNVHKQVTVDGHTDSDPIRTFQYESNWHLSVQRALTVGYQMIQRGMPEFYMSIRGYGSQKPIADNQTNQKIKNRRVELTISDLPTNVPSIRGYDSDEDKKNTKSSK
jgi:chemotaxis protein MotB